MLRWSNRTTNAVGLRTPVAASSSSRAVDSVGANAYQYDAAGNMTTVTHDGRVVRRLVWNGEGQLARIDDADVGAIINRYDADGLRVQQITRQGTSNHYGALADWTPAAGLTKYIYAGSLLVARHHAGERLWYTLDRLGSPRLLTGQAGNATSHLNYAPYGQTTTSTGDPEPIGYNGHRTIGQTTLLDMLARDYDPHLDRMLSADTIIPEIGNPQALNRYSYAYNNPLSYTDPSGHDPINQDLQPPPSNLEAEMFEFLRTSAQFFEIGQRALAMPTLHEQNWDALISALQQQTAAPKVTASCSSCRLLGDTLTLNDPTASQTTAEADPGVGPSTAPDPVDQTPETQGDSNQTLETGGDQESESLQDASSNVEMIDVQGQVAAETSTWGEILYAHAGEMVERAKSAGGLLLDLLAPERHSLRGAYLEPGANGCVFFCFGAFSIAGGYVMTPAGPNDWFFGEAKPFLTVGGAFMGLTPGPSNGSLGEPFLGRPGIYLSEGLSFTVGVSLMSFASDEVRTIRDFSGWARSVGWGAGLFSGERSTNTLGQHITSWGLGMSRGNPAGANVYNTYTWTP